MTAWVTIDQDTYVDTVWYVELARNAGNFNALLYRQAQGDWCGTYRFRFYRDSKVYESDDERSAYRLKRAEQPENDEQARGEMFTLLDAVAIALADREGTRVHRVEIRATGVDAFALITEQPWAQSRPENEDEVS